MAKAIIINGGNNKGSRLTALQQKVESFFKNESLDFKAIYVHDLSAHDLITANFESEEIKKANRQVEEADIIVILTPIFKASFTGILKTYLDLLPQKALEGKVIIPLAIGGSIGHLLSIEYALKPVLSVLGATEILNTVFVIDEDVKRLSNGEFSIEKEAVSRLNAVLKQIRGKQFETLI